LRTRLGGRAGQCSRPSLTNQLEGDRSSIAPAAESDGSRGGGRGLRGRRRATPRAHAGFRPSH
jgi:hypothetical protein